MLFTTCKVEGLGCYSYVIGCPKAGTACVVDPERHVERYLEIAQDAGVKITHIFDTHLHADHITGSAELARRTGATIYVHPAIEPGYAFVPVREGERFRFGSAELEVIETFGHTPNSISLAITDHARAPEPFGLLTGDLLFVGDIGRPDLAGPDLLEQQVRNLYDSLYTKLARFPDWTEVYPAHGEGSLCGSGMSAKPMTTLGYERRHNPLLAGMAFADFHRVMTAGFAIRPPNFAAIVNTNQRGPALLNQAAAFEDLSVLQVEQALADGARIVDTRAQTAFGAAFIPGSVNIGMAPNSVNWLGMVLDAQTRIIIVADSPAAAHEAARRYRRAGYDQIIGYLGNGVSGWALQGKPLDHLPQLTPASLKHVLKTYPDHATLDVRTSAEWNSGHIDGAIHVPITALIQGGVDLHQNRHITVVCGSGYRSNIAGSLLKSRGYTHVFSLIGGMTAWNAAQRRA